MADAQETDPGKIAAQLSTAGDGRDSFDALREAIGTAKMTDDQFLAEMDPAGPDDEGGDGDPGDEAGVLAAQIPKQDQDAAAKVQATKDGIDKAEDGEAGDTTAKSDAEETAAKPEDVEAAASYEDALRALRRAKTPGTVIEGLTREQVLAWGGPLAKIQRDTDGKITELQSLRSRVSEEPEKPAHGATNAPKTEAIAPADLSKLAETLGLDEEGGVLLRQGLDALVAPLAAKFAERDQRDSRRDAAVARLMLKDAAAELSDRFPQLKDPAKLQAVTPRVLRNINTGDYASMADALADAAKAEFYDEQMQAQVQATEKKALARARGRMSAPSQRPKSAESLSTEERLDAVLSGIDNGESEGEIRARSGW